VAIAVVVVAAVAVAGGIVILVTDDSADVLVDTFSRADRTGGLGQAPSGPRWDDALGSWGIADGLALVTDPEPGANVVVAPMPGSDGTVQVKLDRVVQGSGLVFRYESRRAYWQVVAAPDFLTWQVSVVQDGNASFVANTGTYSPIADSTTVAVRSDGASLEILVNGLVRSSISNDFLMHSTAAGMIASGPEATDARFARFGFSGS
jgi:hypothetical protein